MLFLTRASVLLATLAQVCLARVVEYKWEATWVNAAPDGYTRPVIGINNAWPCPEIRAKKGDTIKVVLKNGLGNQTTGIHFHGINQISTAWMDGPSLVTQCPVPPGSTIVYQFLADEAGTYWWHSHNLGQYPDGMRGPLIVEDTHDPFKRCYDKEYTLLISDWYHNDSISLARKFLSPENSRGIPPLPNGLLLNDGAGADYKFEVGKRYRLRLISVAAFASFMLQFDSLDMKVIMNDGAYVKKTKVSQLRIAPAQRFDVILEVKKDNTKRNYPFLVSLDQNLDWTTNNLTALNWPHNATGYVITDPAGDKKPIAVDRWQPYDDSTFRPWDGKKILAPATKTFVFNFNSGNDKFGIHRSFVNGATYVHPKVPTLYTVATTGEYNTNPIVYGGVNPFIISDGDIVDIVVNNHDRAAHPFHLHGHHFQVLTRPASGTGNWTGTDKGYNTVPPKRDTVVVMSNSFAVLRFEANNPGVYLFHCHIEWHVVSGLSATIIEGPEKLRNAKIPKDHIEACKKAGIPYKGNAGGAVDNPLDTSGIVLEPSQTYEGAEWHPPVPRSRARHLIF